jgi:hypothetical protein
MRRSRTTNNTGTVDGSLAQGGNGEHTSPLWLLATAAIFAFFLFIFETIQITSTVQAVLNFLQTTLTVTPAMTAQDLLKMQQGSLGSSELIANAIGWSVQIFLLIASFPSEHYIAWNLGQARRFMMYILIGADWLTDALYVLQGRTVFDGFMHFAPGAVGVLIIAIIFPIALTGVTVFCGIELAHRIDRLFHRIKHI